MTKKYTFTATIVPAGTQEEVHLRFTNLTLQQAKDLHDIFTYNESFSDVSLTRWGWEEQFN
jgi:hypothetical protein